MRLIEQTEKNSFSKILIMFSQYILYLSATLKGSYHRPRLELLNRNFVPRHKRRYRIQHALRVFSSRERERDRRGPLFTPARVRSSFYKVIKASLFRARENGWSGTESGPTIMRAGMQTDSRGRPSRRTRCCAPAHPEERKRLKCIHYETTASTRERGSRFCLSLANSYHEAINFIIPSY